MNLEQHDYTINEGDDHVTVCATLNGVTERNVTTALSTLSNGTALCKLIQSTIMPLDVYLIVLVSPLFCSQC